LTSNVRISVRTRKMALQGLFVMAGFLIFSSVLAGALILNTPKFKAPPELPELLSSVSEIETLRKMAKLILSVNENFAVGFVNLLWYYLAVSVIFAIFCGITFWRFYRQPDVSSES
ncbi:hypothetical protein C3Y98_00860, partial [Methylotenera oryzisoli]